MSFREEERAAESELAPVKPIRSEVAIARVAHLEVIVSNVLRWGVVISFLIMLLASVLLFLEGGQSVVVRLTGTPIPHDPGQVVIDALHLQPKGIIDLGLMLLIATPIMRVAVSVLGFIFEEDVVYTLVALFVLLVLLASLFLGRVE